MRVLTSVLEMEFCTKRRALVASCGKSRVLNNGVFVFVWVERSLLVHYGLDPRLLQCV